MHVGNFVVAAAATTSTRARAARKPASTNAGASAPGATESASVDPAAAPLERNAATTNKREFTWLSKSLTRIAAAWRRRSRSE
jgi:hypothetical protein